MLKIHITLTSAIIEIACATWSAHRESPRDSVGAEGSDSIDILPCYAVAARQYMRSACDYSSSKATVTLAFTVIMPTPGLSLPPEPGACATTCEFPYRAPRAPE